MQIVTEIKIIGIASKLDSILLKASDVKLILPKVKEADVTGMVPTSSTSISLLLGDSLATTVMYQKNFQKRNLKYFILAVALATPSFWRKILWFQNKKCL